MEKLTADKRSYTTNNQGDDNMEYHYKYVKTDSNTIFSKAKLHQVLLDFKKFQPCKSDGQLIGGVCFGLPGQEDQSSKIIEGIILGKASIFDSRREEWVRFEGPPTREKLEGLIFKLDENKEGYTPFGCLAPEERIALVTAHAVKGKTVLFYENSSKWEVARYPGWFDNVCYRLQEEEEKEIGLIYNQGLEVGSVMGTWVEGVFQEDSLRFVKSEKI